jgi:hypothetical protein
MTSFRMRATVNDKDVTGEAIVVAALLVILAIVPVLIVHGFVVSIMWGWFMVPLGVPAIGIAHAIGLAGMLGALNIAKSTDKVTGRAMAWIMDMLLIRPAILLGIGWITKQFM